MYYYKGEKIGKFDIAYEKIFANKEMTRELVAQLIDSFTEEYAKDLLRDIVLAQNIPNRPTWIEWALHDMADGWCSSYFKEPGEFLIYGDFAFEDWEGEE